MMALFKRILNFSLLVLQRSPSSLVPYAATKNMSRDRAKNKGEIERASRRLFILRYIYNSHQFCLMLDYILFLFLVNFK